MNLRLVTLQATEIIGIIRTGNEWLGFRHGIDDVLKNNNECNKKRSGVVVVTLVSRFLLVGWFADRATTTRC
jgi:hypothetical protein